MVELRLATVPGRLRIEVIDQGPPTRPAVDEPDAEDDARGLRQSGRGLEIVDALADKWGHEQHWDHAMWWVELWTEKP